MLYVNIEPIRLLPTWASILPRIASRVRRIYASRPALSSSATWIKLLSPSTTAERRVGSGGDPVQRNLAGALRQARVSGYLEALSKDNVEHYRDSDIYIIPLEGRTLRVALLGLDLAAASNTEDPDVIHGMIDRYKRGGTSLRRPAAGYDYYHRVPFGSLLWTIARPPAAARAEWTQRTAVAGRLEQLAAPTPS